MFRYLVRRRPKSFSLLPDHVLERTVLKFRRRFRKPFNKLFHRQRYFVSRYLGADFLLQPIGIGTLEISAKISERPELSDLMARCADFKPELFIDIGANIGMYSCTHRYCGGRKWLQSPAD
jgi:hypothetical protein